MTSASEDRRELPRALGWVTLAMLVVLFATGIVLYGYYRPREPASYHDMKYLEFDVPFGMLMRNLHRVFSRFFVVWVAALAIARLILALVRPPASRFGRVWPWVALPIASALAFAGFVPWDQLSTWAVTAAAEDPQLGHEGPFSELMGEDARYDARKLLTAGRLVDGASLRRFYILHLGVLPVLAVTLVVLDAWPLRRRKKQKADSCRDLSAPTERAE